MKFPKILQLLMLGALTACGSSDVELGDDGGVGSVVDADPSAVDADPNAPDAMPSTCFADGAACNNCIDDDEDGFIDGADPECTGYQDDDESSFETGIPGDNVDAIIQDCFFDGNSGGGNDGCAQHVCCLLEPFVDCCEGNQTPQNDGCIDFTGPKYDPAECVSTQACTDNCAPLTPPGCDCFGCCTVCNGTDCADVLTNPAIYEEPNCSANANPAQGECCESEHLEGCYSCTKSAECGGGTCDASPTDCILCPGQSVDDLPASCNGDQTCPNSQTACQQTSDCGQDQYCSNGCCVSSIIIN